MKGCTPTVATIGLLLCLSGSGLSVSAESLYRAHKYESLVSDHRSHKVGQSLTILIFEQASAQTNADTNTNTDVGVSAEVELAPDRERGALALRNNFAGGGGVSRSGRLVASVSVTIEEVLPTGELWVKGEQLIELNDEKQHIVLSGRVRRQDISAQNTVSSTRLANAKITYLGDGVLADGQRPGVLTRFFNWLF